MIQVIQKQLVDTQLALEASEREAKWLRELSHQLHGETSWRGYAEEEALCQVSDKQEIIETLQQQLQVGVCLRHSDWVSHVRCNSA